MNFFLRYNFNSYLLQWSCYVMLSFVNAQPIHKKSTFIVHSIVALKNNVLYHSSPGKISVLPFMLYLQDVVINKAVKEKFQRRRVYLNGISISWLKKFQGQGVFSKVSLFYIISPRGCTYNLFSTKQSAGWIRRRQR